MRCGKLVELVGSCALNWLGHFGESVMKMSLDKKLLLMAHSERSGRHMRTTGLE